MANNVNFGAYLVDGTENVKGVVQFATEVEAAAGVLTNKAVTPAGVAATVEELTNFLDSADFWNPNAAENIVYVSSASFTTTTVNSFFKGDTILLNGENICTVLSVGATSPYLVTIITGTVPETITSIKTSKYVTTNGSVILNNDILHIIDVLSDKCNSGKVNDSDLLDGKDSTHYDCAGNCSWTCMSSCIGGCHASCTGGCMAGCTGSCTSCTGTCIGSCSSSCTGGCTGCTSCSSTCTGGCTGCTGCTGSCSGTCVGTCTGTCTGCTGSCSGTCQTSCKNTCLSNH